MSRRCTGQYCKGKLDAVSAIAAMSRPVNPDWWLRQLKGQRTRWRESLRIAIGKVNRDASPYASKQASASGAPRSPVNNCGLGGKKQLTNWHYRQAGSPARASTSDNLRVLTGQTLPP